MSECPITCKVEDQLETILEEVRGLKSAFPLDEQGEADILGHRRFHDAKIAAAKAEEEFWRELKLDLAKKGAWALLLVILGLILLGLTAKFKGVP